tara:strand:+ start:787 stop:996 length:210 start_codon:yes stop_codon:yes gene_type:complete
MTEKCETMWSPTEDQIDNIIIPVIQGLISNMLNVILNQFPPSLIVLMIRDIADTFEKNAITSEKGCGFC